MYTVFIDGKEGTTGLKIFERFKNRSDIEIIQIDEEKRKDPKERSRLINESDYTFFPQKKVITHKLLIINSIPNQSEQNSL